MTNNPRINPNMSKVELVIAMSEGNPGALNVIMQMLEVNSKVDPTSAFGEFTGLIMLDMYGIYGSGIWVLYKDICGQNIKHMLGLLRAAQLGFIDPRDLKKVVDGAMQGVRPNINLEDLLKQLKESLPEFDTGV